MQIFDGKKEAQLLDEVILKHIRERGMPHGDLLILQVGNDLPSEKFANLKMNLCHKLGISARYERIEAEQDDILIERTTAALFHNKNVKGGIIQLPLPRSSIQNVLNEIPYNKDLDVLSEASMKDFYANKSIRKPPVVRALGHFLAFTKANTANLRVGIVGGGLLVGQPIVSFLLLLGAKVTIMDEDAQIRPELLNREGIAWKSSYETGHFLEYDLVVLAAGKPKLVKSQDIAEGAMVIDFGSSIIEGRTVGDLDMETDASHLDIVSPSPKGMGPLVIRYLIMNFLGL